MRLSKLYGKEIVTLPDCERLGYLGDCDMLIDNETGKIKSLIIPENKGFFNFFIEKKYLEIPWERIKKVGSDMIIIDLADILK